MSDLEKVSPIWSDDVVGGYLRSSSAIVSLGSPAATPDAPETTLYLEVEVSDEDMDLEVETDDEEHECDDDQVETWIWRFGISEEEAGFGEAEYESGQSPDPEEAKSTCWRAVVDTLRSDGYLDREIADADGLHIFENGSDLGAPT